MTGAGGSIDWTAGGAEADGSADPPPGDVNPVEPGASMPADALGDDPGDGSPAAETDQPAVTEEAFAAGDGENQPTDDEVILDDIASLESTVEAERDDYLERLQRLQAEFENYRKRMTREQTEALDRGAQRLALELLPALDGCEAALQQGRDDVEPIHAQLVELLGKAGLERNGEPGDPFDPELHEAVMHEPADEGDESVSAIAEVLRAGYSWKGRVLRPAMVKVKG